MFYHIIFNNGCIQQLAHKIPAKLTALELSSSLELLPVGSAHH
jgi:hypothetical protein